jgi:uncharacterized protein YoxC
MEEKKGNLITQTLTNHGERISEMEKKILLVEKDLEHASKEREKILESQKEIEKKVDQNTTTMNMLVDTLMGETGTVQEMKKVTRQSDRNNGAMAFGAILITAVAGWLFYQSIERDRAIKGLIETVTEVKTVQAIKGK